MTHRTEFEDYPDEEWVDDEDDDDVEWMVCPACHQDVHEDTQQCPHCGDWITPTYPKRPTRQLAGAIIVLLLIIALVALTIR